MLRCLYVVLLICFYLVTSCAFDKKDELHKKQIPSTFFADSLGGFRSTISIKKPSKYKLSIIIVSETDIDFDSKKIKYTYSTEVGLLYEILKDTGKNFSLKIVYDKLRVSIKNKDAEEEILDADNPSGPFNSIDNILAAMKGTTIHAVLSVNGSLVSITGDKEVYDKVMGNLNQLGAQEKSKVNEFVARFVGEDFVKNNITQNFKIFPDTVLYEGFSWNKQSNVSDLMNFQLNSVYKLESIEDGVATIKTKSTIGSDKNQEVDIMGNKVFMDVKGSGKGKISVDLTTGMLIESSEKIEAEGTMTLMNKTADVESNYKRTVKIEEIK